MADYTETVFNQLRWVKRRREIRRRLDWAEWNTAEPQPSEVRFHLRRRARSYEHRAYLLFAMLFFTVIAGIVFFLATPILTELRRNRAELLEEQIRLRDGEIQILESEAQQLASETADALAALDHWYLREIGASAYFRDAAIASDGRGVIVGDGGAILYTDDGGANWRDAAPKGLTGNLWSVAMNDEGQGVIVGDGARVLVTRNGGENWRDVSPKVVDEKFLSVTLAADGSGVIVGSSGYILFTRNGGETWKRVAQGLTESNLVAAALAGDGTGVIVGDEGAVLFTSNRGETWRDVAPDGPRRPLRAVALSPEGTGVAVGGDGTILFTQDKGETWRDVSPTGVAADFGSVALGDDGSGVIVTSISVGTASKNIEGPSKSASISSALGTSSGQGTGTGSPEAATIFYTADRGESWRPAELAEQRAVYGAAAMAVDGRGTIVMSDGAILITGNRGQSWRQIDLGGVRAIPGAVSLWGKTGALIVGQGGTIVARLPELTAGVRPASGIEELRLALEALPAHAADGPLNDLKVLEGRRDQILALRTEHNRGLEETREGLDMQGNERRLGQFADALARCAGATPSEGIIEACASALRGTDDATQGWWLYLVERVPGSILLLFLLATLGGLYRYNLRMSAFYSARADALDMMANPTNATEYDAYSQFFGAEKVEFKDQKTPMDVVSDVTKAAAERFGPKLGG